MTGGIRLYGSHSDGVRKREKGTGPRERGVILYEGGRKEETDELDVKSGSRSRVGNGGGVKERRKGKRENP